MATTTTKQRHCKATTKSGKPCRSFAQGDAGYCFMHDPTLAAERAEARRKGGQARHNRAIRYIPGDDPVVAINTIEDIRCLLEWGINDLLKMERSIKRTHALARLLSVAIQVNEQTEIIQRLDAHDQRFEHVEGKIAHVVAHGNGRPGYDRQNTP